MDLLAAVLTTTAAIELFGTLLFALAYVRRPVDRENGLAALLCIAALEHAAGSLFAWHAKPSAVALAAGRAAGVGLGAALAVGVHLALAYRGRSPSWRTLAAPYAIAAWFAVLALRGQLSGPIANHAQPGLLD